MNQGRIWCVVHPTVGLPLFLGSVAVTALIVHASVLTNTRWFGNYWAGRDARTSANEVVTPPAVAAVTGDPAFTITVAPAAASDGGSTALVITVSPRSTASVGAPSQPPDQLALANPTPR